MIMYEPDCMSLIANPSEGMNVSGFVCKFDY